MATADSYGLFWPSVDGDRGYDADSFEKWMKKFFTSGVMDGDLQVVQKNGMIVTVGTGYCNTDGKIKFFESVTDVSLDPANSIYPRIDTIVIERNNADRNVFIHKVTGAYNGTAPVPTAPVRNDGVYQLVLAEIYVAAGASEITQTDITDKRTDTSVCGWIVQAVQSISFEQFVVQFQSYFHDFEVTNFAEFEEWFDHMKGQLSEDAAGNLQEQIDDITGTMVAIDNTKYTWPEYRVLPQETKMDGKIRLVGGGQGIHAAVVPYDNTESHMQATDVQEAVDELNTHLNAMAFAQIYSSAGLKIYKNNTEVLIEFRGQASAGSALGNIIADISQLGGTPHPLIDSFTCVPKNHVVGIATDGKATLYNNALSTYDVDTIYGTIRYKYA